MKKLYMLFLALVLVTNFGYSQEKESLELIRVRAKVYLGGPFSLVLNGMPTGLTSNISLKSNDSSTYGLMNTYKWRLRHVKEVSRDFMRNNGIVDWIIVELRNTSNQYYPEAGFLLKDGIIVDTDGNAGIRINAPSGYYYLVIHHRNHLSIMSADTMYYQRGAISDCYDFTQSEDAYFGHEAQHLGKGNWGMIAGDGYLDNFTDKSDWMVWDNDQGKTGYLFTDYDLNGVVNYEDLLKYLTNRFRISKVPFIYPLL